MGEIMYSEEDLTNIVHTMCRDWDNLPIQVDLRDDIATVKIDTVDEAYDILSEIDNPRFYSLTKVDNGGDIYYKFRYVKEI
jgi:hypothetical protein